MAVPKRKHSKARKNKRKSHLAIKATALRRCARCNSAVKPHTICTNCGHYRGRMIIDLEAEKHCSMPTPTYKR